MVGLLTTLGDAGEGRLVALQVEVNGVVLVVGLQALQAVQEGNVLLRVLSVKCIVVKGQECKSVIQLTKLQVNILISLLIFFVN